MYYKFPINNITCTTILMDEPVYGKDYSTQWKNLIIPIVLEEDFNTINKHCAVKHENIYFAFNTQ
jgi:hypothetical protein